MEYLSWFISSAGMVAGSIFLAQFVNTKIPNANDVVKWGISLVSSEAFAFTGWLFVARVLNFGIFVDTESMIWSVQSVAISGIGITLVANRIFSLDDVRAWLRQLFGIELPQVK